MAVDAAKKIVRQKHNLLHIQFPYDPETVSRVRELPGRKWHPREREWTAPATNTSIELLRSWGFSIPESLKTSPPRAEPPPEEALRSIRARLPARLWDAMYPYQREGVAHIEQKGGRALVADDMGLGKTLQALAWTAMHPELRPVVIVCPATLKLNWARECAQWLHKSRVHICNGRKPEALPPSDHYIVNYDLLNGWWESLRALRPSVVILDETHYIKNQKAQRTKAAKQLCKGAQHVISLSGTPILNRPVEFFPTLNVLDPNTWKSFWRFAQTYCGARHNGYGWDFSGATNTDALHNELVNSCMIRRTKRDVLPQLPPKQRNVIPLEIDRREYGRMMKALIAWLRENTDNPAQAMVQIEKTKQAVIRAKLQAATEWVQGFLHTGEPLVLFAIHHNVVDHLMEQFPEAVKVDGRTTAQGKQAAVDAFQNGKAQLFIGNVKAAGVGITLSAGSNVAFLELGWTPGEMVQAEDRVYGRVDDPHGATAYYLVGADTIEEDIASLLAKKAKVLDEILDGGAGAASGDLLSEIITTIKEDKKNGSPQKKASSESK